jgi:hypothetical protein
VSGIADDDFERYSVSGPCSIQGQAFLKTLGGDVKFGAGEVVWLMPDIPLLNEIIRINSTAGQYAVLPPEVESKWQMVTRQTQADGWGKFEFNGIPCGAWFVISQVTWVVMSDYFIGIEGGPVWARVAVTAQSSPARVMLSYRGPDSFCGSDCLERLLRLNASR